MLTKSDGGIQNQLLFCKGKNPFSCSGSLPCPSKTNGYCVFLPCGCACLRLSAEWPIHIFKEKWMEEPKFHPVGIQPCVCLCTCVVVHGPLFSRCVCQLFFLLFSFLSLDLILTFPYDMIPLLVLILSHFYVIKPDEASGPNTHNENRELFLIPGMPMVNNAAQLLEWTASYINGFQSFWRDALF